MKYNYNFKLQSETDSSRIYKCDNKIVRFDFLEKNIVRFALFDDKYEKDEKMLPTFCVNPNNAPLDAIGRDKLSLDGFSLSKPNVVSNGEKDVITLENGVVLEIRLFNMLVNYKLDGKRIFGDRGPLAYNFGGEFGRDTIHYISRMPSEKIFGLGDKGGDVNKAGRSFVIDTADSMGYSAKESDPLYKHIPFFICENDVSSYGIFYDTSDVSIMNCGKEINNYYEPYKFFRTEDDTLVEYIFFGSKLEILQSFCKLVGKRAFPPRWSFDYCASTMAYTDAENAEEEMDGFLKKIDILDLNCRGFYLSSGYTSIGNQRCVFHWNRDKFPSPEKFIQKFNDAGVNLIPNIKPAFLESHPLYDEIAKKGLFVKNKDGSPFLTRFWDGFGSYLDFTNKQAFDFWGEKVKTTLLDYGMHATWNDNNEYDIKDDDATAEGFGFGKVKAKRIRSNLTYLMSLSSHTAQTKKYPELRPFLSSRSGNVAVRRLAQTWSGDNNTSFEDLRYCHNIGLTMSMSGLFFYGHDLGGFAGDMPSSELLLRWLRHGVFRPRFTIHSWNKDGSATMPWSYPETLETVRSLFKQRKELIPYLYNAAYNSVRNDVPITSPLFLLFDDKNIPTENDCLMFGNDILVGFVLDEGKDSVRVYLPKDCDWYMGDKFLEGGHTVSYYLPASGRVPYFTKAGSVVPLEKDELEFTVFSIFEGEFESTFFSDDGTGYGYLDNDCIKIKFVVKCTDDEVVVNVKNLGNISFMPKLKLVESDKRKFSVICD